MANLEEIVREAWATARTDSQPLYDELIPEYRAFLLKRAEPIYATKYPTGDGVLGAFDQHIADYDRWKAIRADEAAEVADVTEKPKQGNLPADFPHLSLLHDADIRTFAQLRKAGDLTSIKGIGPAKAKEIEG